MSEQRGGEKEASPEGGETDNLEIICGYGEKKNLIRPGKQKAHQAARRYASTQEKAATTTTNPGNRKAASKQCRIRAIPTETNEAQGFAADARGPGRHLADVLHALDARAFSESLVEPSVSSVEVEDVAQGGVSRLLHSRRGNVAHGDAWAKEKKKNTGAEHLIKRSRL